MKTDTKSYNQIFKATSLFGGVQLFNILVAIVRSKTVAVFLGPAGMGILAILTSTTTLITNLTNFGLNTSAVKQVVAASNTGDTNALNRIINVFKKLILITGFTGLILMLVLSPLLSYISFGNYTYSLSFAVLSLTILLAQISLGQTVILRGLRKIKEMAASNMIGGVLGLLASIPLYFFLKTSGIVPAVIVSAFISMLVTYYFTRNVNVSTDKISLKEVYGEGREMLKMGFLINLSNLITVGSSYIVRIFINYKGGVEDVGFYTAGFAIVSTYVGMIFTAMSTDYYPRLASVSSDNEKCREEINQQAEVGILLIGPILVLFLVFIKVVMPLLYSYSFLSVIPMLKWAIIGIFFKTGSWAIGFILLAKNDNRKFFINEVISNAYLLTLNLLGYYFFGLTGLGLSFLLSYLLHFIQMYYVSNKYYKIFYHKAFFKLFFIQLSLALACFLVTTYLSDLYAYPIGIFLILTSGFISLKELTKRTDLIRVFTQKITRKK